jgi:hypothetical protein
MIPADAQIIFDATATGTKQADALIAAHGSWHNPAIFKVTK